MLINLLKYKIKERKNKYENFDITKAQPYPFVPKKLLKH